MFAEEFDSLSGTKMVRIGVDVSLRFHKFSWDGSLIQVPYSALILEITGWSFVTSINVRIGAWRCPSVSASQRTKETYYVALNVKSRLRNRHRQIVFGDSSPFEYIVRPSLAVFACRIIIGLFSRAKQWKEVWSALVTIRRASKVLRKSCPLRWLFLCLGAFWGLCHS